MSLEAERHTSDSRAWGIVVIDTNVLVSALLKPGSVPALALDRVWEKARIAYDRDAVDEYVAVLARARLGIDLSARQRLLARINHEGLEVTERSRYDGAMPDEDDRHFVELAIAAKARALCTGNLRDYPRDLPVQVLTPAMLLAELSD